MISLRRIISITVLIFWSSQGNSHFLVSAFWNKSFGKCASLMQVQSKTVFQNNSLYDYNYDYYIIGGAGGAGAGYYSGYYPTSGEKKSGRLKLRPGEQLTAIVGGGGGAAGVNTIPLSGSGGAGYFNGGSGGVGSTEGGGGGGGSSAIIVSGTLVAVANGGNGGVGYYGNYVYGGNGGSGSAHGTGGTGTTFSGASGNSTRGGVGFSTNGEVNTGAYQDVGGYSGGNGGSYGSAGQITGQSMIGGSGGSGGGYGSGGGSKASLTTTGRGAVSWTQTFYPINDAGKAAVSYNYAGNAGLIVLCKKDVEDFFINIPFIKTSQLGSVITTPYNLLIGSGTTTLQVSGSGQPEFSVDYGAWVTSATVTSGSVIAFRQTSAVSGNAKVTAYIDLGYNRFFWSVSTYPNFFLNLVSSPAVALNSLVQTTSATLTGSGTYTLTSLGFGTPQMSVNGGAWSNSVSATAGDLIVLRANTPNSMNARSYANIICHECENGILAKWEFITGQMTIPSFNTLSGQETSTLVYSNTVTVSGTVGMAFTLSGSGNPQISINGGAWVTSGVLNHGDNIRLSLTTSPTLLSTYVAQINFGGTTASWSVSTGSMTIPAFNSLTYQNINSLVLSNTVSVTGTVSQQVITLSGSGNPQMSINGGGWVSSGTVFTGQTLQLRLTTPSLVNTNYSVNVLNAAAQTLSSWSVTTGSLIYNLGNVSGATSGSVVSSIIATTSGGVTVPISVSGDGNPEISINGGAWVTSGTITAGQTLQARLTYNGGLVSVANINAGGEVRTWSVSNLAYSPTITSGSAVLKGSSGMSAIFTGNVDDTYIGITLPFNVFISGVGYTNWFVGSNTYITAGTGSANYSSLSGSNPSFNKFMLGAADNSYQTVWTKSGTNYYRVRYEGSAATSGNIGYPTILYEFTFYKDFNNQQYAEVVFAQHGRNTGAFGVASASSYYSTAGSITPNSSYVFVGNASGTVWTMYPNSKIVGPGLDQ